MQTDRLLLIHDLKRSLVALDNPFHALNTDVISIAKTNENFRLLYDNKGRFTLHHISAEEAKVIFVF